MYLCDLSKRMLTELAYFMVGDHIGGGSARQVFTHPHDRSKVVKIENAATSFQNVKEWEFWREWQSVPEVARWLAPCHFISDSGSFLIMSKTDPLPSTRIPKKVPRFLTDHKRANFGLLSNRVVCHDYGLTVRNVETALKKWRGNDD